ncbi:MAG: hypothetical protein ACW97Z_01760 [Candidatus Hodarchaeales archaeon]|jgi:DNA repair exonuclease SbcCD ATPase subunit
MTPRSLKEFGLEFINEMAKDRKVSQQEIGVVVSGTKSTLLSQGLPHFSYQDIDALVKNIRKETARIVDSELTRITIKSLGRIKDGLAEGGFIIQEEASPERESELEQLRESNFELKNQIKEKNSQLKHLENEKTDSLTQLAEKTDQITVLEADVKRIRSQLDNQQKELEVHQTQSKELINELEINQAVIERFKEKELIHEKDIQEALASVAETYQIQENYYQRMLEEGIQSRTKEIRQEMKIDLEELTTKLETQNQRLEDTTRQHKITVGRLEEAVTIAEDELSVAKAELAKAITERLEKNVLLDYTQRLLSTHPLYASILILLNLGGVLDLSTLAMSVGAHPLKLRQMLEDLVTKGLITISEDDPPTIAAVMV